MSVFTFEPRGDATRTAIAVLIFLFFQPWISYAKQYAPGRGTGVSPSAPGRYQPEQVQSTAPSFAVAPSPPMRLPPPLPPEIRSPSGAQNTANPTGSSPNPTNPNANAPRSPTDIQANVEPTLEDKLGEQLISGQPIRPIDLAGTLRLAGGRNLDIEIARRLVFRAVADLQAARALWLPSLFIGPTWYREDGQIQTISGQVINANRSSLFFGGLATGPNSYPANPPGSGFPPLTGLASVVRFSDAILIPRAARRELAASRADVHTATNRALLSATEAHFDLILASGMLAIAREASAYALKLSEITGSYARTGEGLEADHQRILTELKHRRSMIVDAVGQLENTSANLVRMLVLDPDQVLAPVEPAEALMRVIPDELSLNDMITKGLLERPELASEREKVKATLLRLKQARLRPLVPSMGISYAGGGFAGGAGAFVGNFGSRGDATVSLFWELQNLGVGDLATMKRSRADKEIADLNLIKEENQVAADVVSSYKARIAAARRISQTAPEVLRAIDSLRLNLLNIQRGAGVPGATRPIEVLQPIQALAQARTDYLRAVVAYNRAQYQLYYAIGWPAQIQINDPAFIPQNAPPAMQPQPANNFR